jgi:hypothetical protein
MMKSIHVGARFTWDMWKHDGQLKCSSTHIKDCKELTLDKIPKRKWKQINIKIQLKFKGAKKTKLNLEDQSTKFHAWRIEKK